MNIEPKKVLFVVANNDFRDEELAIPKNILEKAGMEVTLASSSGTQAKGMLGSLVRIDINFDSIDSKDYDAIVFIGGSGASEYFNNQKALELAKEFYDSKKIVAAICIAPKILANAGILEGKGATIFGNGEDISSKGARFTGNSVEKDGSIITANGPAASNEFGEEILKALSE